MGVVLDTLHELERQDFAGADKELLVTSQTGITWGIARQVIEFPEETVERLD
jgi:hypothetical protein